MTSGACSVTCVVALSCPVNSRSGSRRTYEDRHRRRHRISRPAARRRPRRPTATTSSSSPAARPARARPLSPRSCTWTPDGPTGPWAAEIDGADAVVNLAGESIAAKRWSAAQKQRILDSRVHATRSLVEAIAAAATPAAGLRQRIGRRLLRTARRRDRDRGDACRLRFSRPRLRAVGGRSRARRERPHARGRASARASCSSATAARCRRCCRRSGSASADRSDRAGSTGRGFIARTGSISCAGPSTRPPRRARSTPRRRIRSPTPSSRTRSDARCIVPPSCRRRRSRCGCCWAKWPTRCCCPVSARCRRRPSALGFTFHYPNLDDALRSLFGGSD